MFEIGQEVLIDWVDRIDRGKITRFCGHDGHDNIWEVAYRVNSILSLRESLLRPATPESISKLKQSLKERIAILQAKLKVLE